MADNQNALSAGPRGPLLMQDCQLIEKPVHFEKVGPAHAQGVRAAFAELAEVKS